MSSVFLHLFTYLLVKLVVILKCTFVRILEKMTDEQQDAFTQFVETGPSGEEFLTYVSENVPDADDIVSETIEEFARDILAVTKE